MQRLGVEPVARTIEDIAARLREKAADVAPDATASAGLIAYLELSAPMSVSAEAAASLFALGMGGSTGPVAVRFVFLDQTPEEPEALASTLIANGCLVQVEQMSSAMTSE